MKKFFAVLFAIILAMNVNLSKTFAYPKAVAVITNYDHDKLADKISISRANGKPPGSVEYLYPNDKITGSVKAMKINFAPYASYRVEGSVYVIEYNPPSTVGKILDDAVALASSFWNSSEYFRAGVSRGGENAKNNFDFKPQPGFNATLLSNQTVVFSWWDDVNNKIFSVGDADGNIVFEKNIEGLTSFEIDVKDLNLQAEKNYFWKVNEDMQECKITLPDKETETEILSRLAEIDAEKISENAKTLKKSAYVQLVSDIYSEKIDLYWLSTKWLLNFKPASKAEESEQKILLNKCEDNLKATADWQ